MDRINFPNFCFNVFACKTQVMETKPTTMTRLFKIRFAASVKCVSDSNFTVAVTVDSFRGKNEINSMERSRVDACIILFEHFTQKKEKKFCVKLK